MTTLRGTSTGKTFFDWIQPSMVADGLIVPAVWQAEHAAAVTAEFTDPILKQAAVVLAVLHPHVLDYIGQAPVLVLAAANDDRLDLRLREARLKLASRFIAAAGAFHRLPHILRAYGLVPPLRRLAGGPLKLAHHGLVPLLAAITETRLAQIIPATAKEQRVWLEWLDSLQHRRWTRRASRDRFIAWAAANILTPEARREAGDLADWALFDSERFDPAMSYAQARAASAHWHEEQRTRRPMAAVRARAVSAQTVEYAPLPVAIEVDGFSFRALCSAADLEVESARMHHCVRNYWRYVARGRSYIYSIQRGDARIATLELHRQSVTRYTATPLTIAQLKGPCNARPRKETVSAAARFLELANSCVIAAAQAKAEAAKAAKAQANAVARTKSGRS